MNSNDNIRRRLESLDVLRGLDMFLLVGLQPVLIAVAVQCGGPVGDALLYHLDHEVWVGFRFWDLVMPLFLFMTGAAMPFSFAKYAGGALPRRSAWKHIVKRVAVLWLLGMVVQGNLLGFNPGKFLWYTNTLQAIAAGYLIASMLLLYCSPKMQIWLTVALLLCYSVPMSVVDDWSVEYNFAARIDELVLGSERGDLSYTWVWSSLTFGVTVMLGVFASAIVRRGGERTTLRLVAIGCALIAVAMLWSFETPVIKRIWSGSMTLLSGGICFLLLALFHWWIDLRGHRKGLGWLKVYGMNSIVAYMLGEVVNFRSVVSSVTWGVEPLLGSWWDVWLTVGNYGVLFLLLWWMYSKRVFVKI